MNKEYLMTFDELDARAKEVFGKQRPIDEWPYIDEGDRNYWRKMAAPKLRVPGDQQHRSDND